MLRAKVLLLVEVRVAKLGPHIIGGCERNYIPQKLGKPELLFSRLIKGSGRAFPGYVCAVTL